jgi:hypothetical protein
MRHIVLGLALLVASDGGSWAQTSQQPQSQPQPQQPPNQSTTNQRGTEQSPFIVKAAPKSEEEAATDARERAEKTSLDRQLVKYTRYLAIIAFLQLFALIAQAVFVAWTIVHGRRVERAYVSGGGAFLTAEQRDPNTGQPTFVRLDVFQLTVDNYGKTPARVFNVEIGFCNSNNIPPIPRYTLNRLLNAVIPPNKEGAHTQVRLRRNEIIGDTIFGRFTYEIVFRPRFLPTKIHHAGFVLHITPELGVEPINAPLPYTDWN